MDTTEEEVTTEACFVYMLYDIDGSLLYVGVSQRPELRYQEHRQRQTWGYEIDRMETRSFSTRNKAMAEEEELIATFNPFYNIRSRTTPPREEVRRRANDQCFSVRLSRDIESQVREQAKKEHRALKHFIERVLQQYCDDHQDD